MDGDHIRVGMAKQNGTNKSIPNEYVELSKTSKSSSHGSSSQNGMSAMDDLLEKLEKVKSLKMTEIDIEFLQDLMKHPVMQALGKAHNAFEERKVEAKSQSSCRFAHNMIQFIDEILSDKEVEELVNILVKPHLENLLKAHDTVAKNEANRKAIQLHGVVESESANVVYKAIRMVGLTKKSWEPLGLTIVKQDNNLVVARILHGSNIEKKGLLHVGDIIQEVNGQSLSGDPRALQEYLSMKNGSFVFKIIPSYISDAVSQRIYIKCCIDYDPQADELIPCKDAGLDFKKGNILLVVNQSEEDWWQAQKVNSKGEARSRAGLIPSQGFEEKRRAMEEWGGRGHSLKMKLKKRKPHKKMYCIAQNDIFDRHDITAYEEVTYIPPFIRKTLILLVRVKSLSEVISQEIVKAKPSQYGILELAEVSQPISEDSKESTDDMQEPLHGGDGIFFESIPAAAPKIRFYSRELEGIRKVNKEGKTCVVCACPQVLKLLKTSEFMPYVVLVKQPEEEIYENVDEERMFESAEAEIEKYYAQFVDEVICSNDATHIASTILEKLETLKTKHQWVPTSWVF